MTKLEANILVVDDDAGGRYLKTHVLRKNGYKVTIGDSKLTMRLVNIYGVLIGDLKDEKTPFHAFVKLEIETDSFKVWFFDSGWLEQEIQNRGWPRHEVVDGDVVLTATEEELRRDLPAYLVDPRSWKDEETLERIK